MVEVQELLDTRVYVLMTTYRKSKERWDLLDSSLHDLAAKTGTPCKFFLLDDEGAGFGPLPPVRDILKDSPVEYAGLIQSRKRIGAAAQWNRGFAVAADDVRQTCWTGKTYVVKLDDDVGFVPHWLPRLVRLWDAAARSPYRVGMIGGANGLPGEAVEIGGEQAEITTQVSSVCMLAPLQVWADYMPVPHRGTIDRQDGPAAPSAFDWHVTCSGGRSVVSYGRACLKLEVVYHAGIGKSTWRGGTRTEGPSCSPAAVPPSPV